MLAGQEGGGADHCHLHPGHGGDKGGAHRHLGLAKADITHHQPVHRAALPQIGDDIGDRGQLIVGFLIGKPGAKTVPQPQWRFKHRGLAQRPFGSDPDQPFGDDADTFFQFGLFRLPCPAAKAVQKPLFMAIAAEKFDVFHRQIQFRAFGIIDGDTFVRCPQRPDGLQPGIAPDAMFDMHHQIAGRQRLRLGQEIFGAFAFFQRADQPVAQQVLFGDHRQPVGLKPVFQRPDRQIEAALAGGHIADIAGQADFRHPFIGQQPLDAVARAIGIAGENYLPLLTFCANMVGQGPEQADLFHLAFRCEIAPDPATGIGQPRPGALWQGVQLNHPMPGQARLPRRIIQIQQPRRAGLVNGIQPPLGRHRLGARLILIGDAIPAGQPRRRHLIVEHHRCARQIVEQGFQPLMEKRQPVLHALMLAPRCYRLVQRIIGPGGAELDAVGLAEPHDGGVIQNDL